LAIAFDSFWFAVTKLTDLTSEQELKTMIIEPLLSSLDAAEKDPFRREVTTSSGDKPHNDNS
jgi:hypothetical protein